MGGGGCILIIHALVRYEEVPASHKDKVELEAQLRQCYANPTIAAAVVEDMVKAEKLWKILEKEHLSAADLGELLKGLPEYAESAKR